MLTEFRWVRELNEGVKRIYEDMEDFFLEEPMYSENRAVCQAGIKKQYCDENHAPVRQGD